MLLELEIRDFAIIEHLRCRLGPGFNVLTGETGAGKSIVVDAMGLLLGDRADTTVVRDGAERAIVQGVFDPGPAADAVGQALEEYGVPPETELILGREVLVEGRSTARINGRVVPVRALGEIGRLLGDMHGQDETTSLKRESVHIELLDRFGGLLEERAGVADLVGRLRDVRRELEALARDEREVARRAESLTYQIDEIAAARLAPGEEEALLGERTRLANAEKLAVLADRAYAALRDPSGGSEGGIDRLDEALEAVEALARIDADLAGLCEALVGAVELLSDRATEVLAYRDRLEFDPPRLEEVEERLALIGDLKRKYGPDIPAILAHAERAQAERDGLTSAGERASELGAEAERLLAHIGLRAGALSRRRSEAGKRLAERVESELQALGMAGSRFLVSISRTPDPEGATVDDARVAFDARGVDQVAFLVSANPGEPPRPLVAVASGGETARLMLALKTVLQSADRVPVLVFDEIDAGIGGRVGAVVGRRLWDLAAHHQVLCVTHLPQVAAYGDVHWHVRKRVADGRTVTEMTPISAADRVTEIAQMLGTSSKAGRDSALQLLQQAEGWKSGRRGTRT